MSWQLRLEDDEVEARQPTASTVSNVVGSQIGE
jgi:hypothetical protein